jgi:hypothetical protein
VAIGELAIEQEAEPVSMSERGGRRKLRARQTPGPCRTDQAGPTGRALDG